MDITKKILPEYFNMLNWGIKLFEIRLANFDVESGDTLILKEWNGEKFTGNFLKKRVTCVFKSKDLKFWSKELIEKYGFQIIGLTIFNL